MSFSLGAAACGNSLRSYLRIEGSDEPGENGSPFSPATDGFYRSKAKPQWRGHDSQQRFVVRTDTL